MSEIATSKSWKNTALGQTRQIKTNIKFTSSQFEKIKQGFIPKTMEDRWFIYFEDSWLHFCRSWTGDEVYRASVKQQENNYEIDKFLISANDISNDEKEREILERLIEVFLL